MLQNLHLITALSARDNLRLARALAGLPDDGARIGRLLDELGLTARAAARPPEISQGEAQRLAIARAVVNPAGLDPGRRADLRARPWQLRRRPGTAPRSG